MAKIRAYVIIKGFVQPAIFLYELKKLSVENGLKGRAKYTWEGDVEVVFEGEKDSIDKVLSSCRNSMPFIRISGIETTWQDFEDEFSVFSA